MTAQIEQGRRLAGGKSNTFDIHMQREGKSGISRRLRARGKRGLGQYEGEKHMQSEFKGHRVILKRTFEIHVRRKIDNNTFLIPKETLNNVTFNFFFGEVSGVSASAQRPQLAGIQNMQPVPQLTVT